jgi:hypothetical protein
MADNTLSIRNAGPLRRAEVRFGDLTVFVGPQASGKSVFLQFLELLLDRGPIMRRLRRYGLDWSGDWDEFREIYFGEGMRGIWSEKSLLHWRGRPINMARFVRYRTPGLAESLFFIPAQRVLVLSRDGWLRPFGEYRTGDPYAVREFSERIRGFMESGLGRNGWVFPHQGLLKSEIRRLLTEAVFRGFELRVEKHGPQKRLVMGRAGDPSTMPFMVWSAGQREFVPLLLGLYWLMPRTKVSRRESFRWVAC